MAVIHRARDWSYELQDVFLKNKQIPQIARLIISNLLHSMIVDGKKEFMKNCALC